MPVGAISVLLKTIIYSPSPFILSPTPPSMILYDVIAKHCYHWGIDHQISIVAMASI
jgi:hypothetical protein